MKEVGKPGNIYMITSGKGGAGKTSFAVTLGREISQYGFKILLIELAPGLGSYDLLLKAERGVYSLADYLADGCSIEDCAIPVADEPDLYTILAPTEPDFVYEPPIFREKILALLEKFHTIVMEVPSGFHSSFYAAASVCNNAIILAAPDELSLRDGRTISDRLDAYPGIKQWLVVNRLDVKTFRRKRPIKDLDQAIDTVGAQLLGVIPEDKQLPRHIAKGWELPVENPARITIENIALRMLGETVALGV